MRARSLARLKSAGFRDDALRQAESGGSRHQLLRLGRPDPDHQAAIPPTSLPLFLDYDVFLTSGGGCCILGYHSATVSNQTYAFAAYSDPGIFSVPIEDVHALSHELGEWMDDPLINNATPAWGNIGQVSGCQNNLEVGDPLTGTAFTATLNGFTYHPQELVFFSWFSRDNPSIAVNGFYSFNGTFTTPAAACP